MHGNYFRITTALCHLTAVSVINVLMEARITLQNTLYNFPNIGHCTRVVHTVQMADIIHSHDSSGWNVNLQTACQMTAVRPETETLQ